MKISYILFILAVLQNKVIAEVLRVTHLRKDVHAKLCSEVSSYQATRNTPYLETYKERSWGPFHKTKTRLNYKLEYFTSWRKEYSCCDGYSEVHRDPSLVCKPICRPACGNGICVEPNVCICNHGYAQEKDIVLDPLCVPVCTRTCVHGKCTAPEQCTCDIGYSLIDDDGYTCEPICPVLCGKGAYCSEPEGCTCLPGYSDIASRCVPVCKDECVHGKCTAPDTCTCDDGYEPDNLFVCKPKCEHDCFYGKCTAPNVCTCDTGYSLKSPNVCEPVCSQPCVMGTCVAPESCSCFKGYGLLENSTYVCEPFCDKACLNGKCTAPHTCTCNKGFQKSGNMWMEHMCKPYCEISCEPFGVCNAPNICTCFDGYRLVDKNQTTEMRTQYAAGVTVCEPICHIPCVNGFCSNPDTCTCNDGYYPSDTTNPCTRDCHRKCVNGLCNEICTCEREPYPPKNNQSNICEPFCEEGCVNGYCSAPNRCTCNVGYQPQPSIDGTNRTNVCEPVCEPNCTNGVCVQPGVCSCNAGYRRTANSTNVCEPVCHPTCTEVHGNCVAPDSCVCQNGYYTVHYNDVNLPFRCEPVCSVECGNGICTAPEVCTCINGYGNAATGECVPVCTICTNGTCVAPEVCKCDDGFFLASTANFVVPDSRVSMDEDGSESRGNGSKCMPRCDSCDGGECVAPEECRCHLNYVLIKGVCVHACHDDCGIHGECVKERRYCKCHYGWSGPRCDEPTLCILSINNEENRTESLIIVEERNDTIEYVLLNNPACPECMNEVSNETLCFNMYTNDTNNEPQISCLIDRGCLTLSGKYKSERKIVILNAIASVSGLLFLISTIILMYVILRKRRNRKQINLEDAHRTSMQGLVEQHTVDSECE